MTGKDVGSPRDVTHGERQKASLTRLQEEDIHRFIQSVGSRVRAARESKAITRRMLSEQSGVSERYLAQLETGDGNISLALLYKIASALGANPHQLFPEHRNSGEEQELLRLFRSANQQLKREALTVLRKGDHGALKEQRYCLIGLRGAGKSTLGQYVARRLGFEFIELNDAIERQCGMAVSEIMALYGQEGYRSLEREAIEAIVESRRKVILAAGGGIVSDPDTHERLMTYFHSIWIKATPEEHMSRVLAQGDDRPVAGNPRAMDELKSILTNREVLYAKADHTVDTSGRQRRESQKDLLAIVAGSESKNPIT